MKTYVSRPTTVEAVLWTGTNESFNEIVDLTGGRVYMNTEGLQLLAGVNGAQGWVTVPVGHFIVRQPGDTSDLWPVEQDYFISKYQDAD